jgi:hypothetical protein
MSRIGGSPRGGFTISLAIRLWSRDGSQGSHLWRAISEHATIWVVGGVLLAATGFAPEEWVARTVNGLDIPESVLHFWATRVDVRIVSVALGITLIAGNMLWRQRTQIAAALPAVVPEPAAPPLPDKPSIAVLPFANLSGDPEQEYFSDGVADDIISELSHDRSLFVIARNSSFIYKGHAVDVKQVARDLGVRYVLWVIFAVRRPCAGQCPIDRCRNRQPSMGRAL